MILIGSGITAAGMLYFGELQKRNTEELVRGRAREEFYLLLSEIKHAVAGRIGPSGEFTEVTGTPNPLISDVGFYDSCRIALGGHDGIDAGGGGNNAPIQTMPWNAGRAAFVNDDIIIYSSDDTGGGGNPRFRGWRGLGAIPVAPDPNVRLVSFGSLLIENIRLDPIGIGNANDLAANFVGAEPATSPTLAPCHSSPIDGTPSRPFWRASSIRVTASYNDPRMAPEGGRQARYFTNIPQERLAAEALYAVGRSNSLFEQAALGIPFRVCINGAGAAPPYGIAACSGLSFTNYVGVWGPAGGPGLPPAPSLPPLCNPANFQILASNPDITLNVNPWLCVRSRCNAPTSGGQCMLNFDAATGGANCTAVCP